MTRPRSRVSARAAGTRFERQIADWLANRLNQPIDRKVRTGAKDRGDLTGLTTADGRRITAELKNTTRTSLATWWAEAVTEATNDGGLPLVIHKRHGIADPAKQWALLDLDTLAKILGGNRCL